MRAGVGVAARAAPALRAATQRRFAASFNPNTAQGQYQTLPDFEQGAKRHGTGMLHFGVRENVARGRYVDTVIDPIRPEFDFMGRLQEWAREKACGNAEDNYWYLDYLTDMEGYPKDVVTFKEPLNPQEHLNLRLWSHAEERKFWKCYYYYHQQYEFETEDNMAMYKPGRYDCIESAMRAAGIGSPALFQALMASGIDDHTFAGLSLMQTYQKTNFNDDILNMLDGHCVTEIWKRAGFKVPREDVHNMLLHLLTLKIIPVEVLDTNGNVVSRKEFTYEEIPTLRHITEGFGLEGGAASWYIDVRNFYSTPGRMIFDEFNYQNFLLDWYLSCTHLHCTSGDKVVQLSRRPTAEEEKERRRGWFHVIQE